jgi:hypothetical protein
MAMSFKFTAADKSTAKAILAVQLDSAVARQPAHAPVRAAMQAAVEGFIDSLADPTEDQEISVMVSGQAVPQGVEGGELISAGFGTMAQLVDA